jgi:hypothetical protein
MRHDPSRSDTACDCRQPSVPPGAGTGKRTPVLPNGLILLVRATRSRLWGVRIVHIGRHLGQGSCANAQDLHLAGRGGRGDAPAMDIELLFLAKVIARLSPAKRQRVLALLKRKRYAPRT